MQVREIPSLISFQVHRHSYDEDVNKGLVKGFVKGEKGCTGTVRFALNRPMLNLNNLTTVQRDFSKRFLEIDNLV